MKINRIIATSLLGIFTSIGAFADAESLPAKDELRKLCYVIAQNDDCGDCEEFVHFITTVKPELDTTDGRDILRSIYKASANNNSSDGSHLILPAQLTTNVINWLEKMEFNCSKLEEVKEMIEKVYPLYVFQTKNRKSPKVERYSNLSIDTIYQAPIDEAYYGLANKNNKYVPTGLSEQEIKEVESKGGRGKRNGSYVWGMGTYKDKLFWSTNNNYLCMQGYGIGGNKPYENKCWACEFGESSYADEAYTEGDPNRVYADIRPPRMYSYDTKTGVVNDITPSMDKYPGLRNCQGLRSCGVHNGVVFFGGPGLYSSNWDSKVSAAFVAYDADNDRIISCSDMSDVDGCKVVNVRRWRVINGVLYVAVGIMHPTTGKKIGALLRWYGDKENPWNFHIVGLVENEAAELAPFNNHIYIGSWGIVSSVNVSPEIPDGGFTPVSIDSEKWPTVWESSVAEPSATLGRSVTSVAGFHEWRDHLYWGLFCPNFYILPKAQSLYGNITSPDALAYILGNYRTPAFWRLDKDNNYEMLYGDTENPKPVYGQDGKIEKWEIESNGLTSKWGRGGFGNIWTIYIWSLQEYNDNLYIGTMDISNLADAGGENIIANKKAEIIVKLLTGINTKTEGFELLRMTDEDEAPKFITKNGFDNPNLYGVRNLEVIDNKLMLGSASMSSLQPNGGWHVHSITDTTIPTSIKQSEIKKPGIIMEHNDEYINIATVGGEKITRVEVFDTEGRKIGSARPDCHVSSIPVQNVKGVSIIKVTSEKGQWKTKICL